MTSIEEVRLIQGQKRWNLKIKISSCSFFIFFMDNCLLPNLKREEPFLNPIFDTWNSLYEAFKIKYRQTFKKNKKLEKIEIISKNTFRRMIFDHYGKIKKSKTISAACCNVCLQLSGDRLESNRKINKLYKEVESECQMKKIQKIEKELETKKALLKNHQVNSQQ